MRGHHERRKAFLKIKEEYEREDREGLRRGQLPMRTTTIGFWGTTNLEDAYHLFTRIGLERFTHLADLGAGDGRVVAVAALFTRATGVEGDHELVEKGKELFQRLGVRAILKEKDYRDENLTSYDAIFMFPDKRYDERMLAKLKREFTGYLFIYNNIHAPPGFKKGKTYWVGQLPIASYPINTAEENLEL